MTEHSENNTVNASSDSYNKIDFTLSIMFASLKSFKGESLIKPLPDFVSTVEELAGCHDQVNFPSMTAIENTNRNQKFLQWTNILADQILVRPFKEDSLSNLNVCVKQAPNFIVEVKNPRMSATFETLAGVHGTSFGFHGTHTENVFSILQKGLCGHLNKRALFGAGTYLSSDLEVAMSFAKQGKSWPNSRICQNMICVLMCKVINSDQVKQGKEKLSGISIKTDSLPHNYYVVKNNDHVTVTHVLLYTSRPRCQSLRNQESSFRVFIRCYWFVLFYGLILVLICLGSNNLFKKWFRQIKKHYGFR